MATVLELSWFGAGEVAIPLGGAFKSPPQTRLQPGRPRSAIASSALDEPPFTSPAALDPP